MRHGQAKMAAIQKREQKITKPFENELCAIKCNGDYYIKEDYYEKDDDHWDSEKFMRLVKKKGVKAPT